MSSDGIDRIAPTRRPNETVIGYQSWWDLLFLHWRLPAAEVEPLIPKGLTLDTWNGDAWIGLVPFTIRGVRPRGLPAVPLLSSTHETNLRTYVHREGRDPGVLFFSLDASNPLAVLTARSVFKLPYFRAVMSMKRQASEAHYESRRLWPDPAGATTRIQAEVGERIGEAAPGTLEHFLIERYILYAQLSPKRLYQGRVWHVSYPLRTARVTTCEQSLLEAAGLKQPGAPDHVVFSDGVSIELFPLRGL